MIQELNANRELTTRGSACSTRLSPASTFKIPHALVALETGVVTAQSVEKLFASAVWNANGGVDLLDGAKLAARTFVETGLLRHR